MTVQSSTPRLPLLLGVSIYGIPVPSDTDMKLFCFKCEKCDSDFLKKKSDASLCPTCRKLLYLTGIFEVMGEPDVFLKIEEDD